MNAYANIAKELKDALGKNSVNPKTAVFGRGGSLCLHWSQLFFWLINLWIPSIRISI